MNRKEVTDHEKIQHAPPLPGNRDTLDRDTKAGCKHRCTDAAMEYLKAEVMEMCHREKLYQIDKEDDYL